MAPNEDRQDVWQRHVASCNKGPHCIFSRTHFFSLLRIIITTQLRAQYTTHTAGIFVPSAPFG